MLNNFVVTVNNDIGDEKGSSRKVVNTPVGGLRLLEDARPAGWAGVEEHVPVTLGVNALNWFGKKRVLFACSGLTETCFLVLKKETSVKDVVFIEDVGIGKCELHESDSFCEK